jgi:hypothetical protein
MMKSIALNLLALVGFVAGQTPVGFKPAATEHLVVKFGDKAVDVPGTAFTKNGLPQPAPRFPRFTAPNKTN